MKSNVLKIVSILFCIILCLSFVGCGEKTLTEPSGTNTLIQTQSENTGTTSTTSKNPPKQEAETCVMCDTPVAHLGDYCSEHKCMLCSEPKIAGNRYYCGNHACQDSGCEQPAVDGAHYCVSHKCEEPNCKNKKWVGSQYCSVHK